MPSSIILSNIISDFLFFNLKKENILPPIFVTDFRITIFQMPLAKELKLCYTMRALADIAQLVEQLICNQQVAGSSPIVGSC